MKHLSFLLLFLFCGIITRAQYISFNVLSQPCGEDGVIEATVTGPTPPFLVTWYYYNNFQNGSYTVLRQDTIYTNVDTVHNVPGRLIHFRADPSFGGGIFAGFQNTINVQPFGLSDTTTPFICVNPGSVSLTPTGGMAPYTYAWSLSTSTTIVETTSSFSTYGGWYFVAVTDAAGCVSYNVDQIHVDTAYAFAYNLSPTTANCTNGAVTLDSLTGGTPPLPSFGITAKPPKT